MEDPMTKHGVARCASALLVGCLSVGATAVVGQTNAAKTSSVGTWKLDLERSKFPSDFPKPQSMTLTILTDTPDAGSWRLEIVAEDGTNSPSLHWSGPKDGLMYPVQDAEGHTVWRANLRNDHDALIRHFELEPAGTIDSRATMSADGNTLSDEVVFTTLDGQVDKVVYVMHRSPSTK
jgi:hypothetical protein